MLKGTSLLESGNLYSPKDYEKNVKIIEKFFLWIDFKIVRMRKIYCISVKSIKNLKNVKYHVFAVKYCFFLVFVTSVEVKMKRNIYGKRINWNNHLWRKHKSRI